MAKSAVCRSVAAAWGPVVSPSAVPADKTACDVKGEQAKALAESVAAVRARQAVGELTGPARSSWGEAQRLADRQAVPAGATAASGPNWVAIAGPVQDNRAAWTEEGALAAQQAEYRTALLLQAPDGEQRVCAAA